MSDFFNNDADLFSDDSIVTTKLPKRSKNVDKKWFSPKQSENSKRHWRNKNYRKRVTVGARKAAIKQHQTMTESMRKQRSAKMSITLANRWQDPEYRAKIRAAQLAGWAAKREREGKSISKTTQYLRDIAAGVRKNARKKKISTPYGVYDSVMDFYRQHTCKWSPKQIRARIKDDRYPDWKYV